MAIPSVELLSNRPGGAVPAAMNAINEYANNYHQRRINKAKADYAPTTVQAEAASKLAYANLMAPQFIAKAMNNPEFMGNLSDQQQKELKNLIYAAGTRNQGQNSLNNSPMSNQQGNTGIGQPSTNSLSGWLSNGLKNALNVNKNPNNMNSLYDNSANPGVSAQGPGVINEGNPFVGRQGYRPTENKPMEIEVNGGQRAPTYAENAGNYKGQINEGAELGSLRAKDRHTIGEQQLQLSNTGANLDKLIEDFTNPEFMAMREEFPFLQDTQLKIAAKTGSPQQREMIGNLVANLESFKGSTINSFKGQTLKREFDYADKIKPTENDTVYSALGKLRALKTLKEIAWQKNTMIHDLMKNEKMDLADAVQKADKEIDIKGISKQIKELTQPTVELQNENTGMTIHVSEARAKELEGK